MGCIIIKLKNRLISVFKVTAYKLLFLRKINVSYSTILYPKTHIMIDGRGRLRIGNNCFFNRNCSINCMELIEIGRNCLFGENVLIYDHNHRFRDAELIRKQGYNTKKVMIGDDCWVGSNVIILAGVTIGDHSVIGAGSVVSKSVPAGCIVVKGDTIRARDEK